MLVKVIPSVNCENGNTSNGINVKELDVCTTTINASTSTASASPSSVSTVKIDACSRTMETSKWSCTKGLNIAHLNVHYLYPKLDEIRQIFDCQPMLDLFLLM